MSAEIDITKTHHHPPCAAEIRFLTRERDQAIRERDQAVEAHRRVVANQSNHYDRYWSPPDESVSGEWLDATEAKMREALGDAFCDDAAAVMLTLIAEIRRLRAEDL